MNRRFGEYLYKLRKEKGLTQSELADMLNITNKAVSKWETGESLPETSQLAPLSEIFNVSIDQLLKGGQGIELIKESATLSEREGIKDFECLKEPIPYKHFALLIILGLAFIMVGIIITLVLSSLNFNYLYYLVPLLLLAGIGVGCFIHAGMMKDLGGRLEDYKDRKFISNYSYSVIAGLYLCIIGAIIVIVLSELNYSYGIYLPIGCLFWILGTAIFIGYGIKYERFAKLHNFPIKEKKGFNYFDAIESAVMLSSLIVFLILGFVWNLWHPGWLAFIVGGIICGIIQEFNNAEKKRKK